MKIKRVSYIGKPENQSVMFVAKKIEHLLNKLQEVEGCLVFVETGMEIPVSLQQKHLFVVSDKPQQAYFEYVSEIAADKQNQERMKTYQQVNGVWLGEDCEIGAGTIIEPGCVIGHGVKIGEHGTIKANSVIKNAVIGDYFLAQEGTRIGTDGFTMVKNDFNEIDRMPTLGSVVIEDHVEVGANSSISAGSAGQTILRSHVKIDALVYIAHDVEIKKNTQVAGNVTIGGFSQIGSSTFLGFAASIKNRVSIGNHCMIGMGAVILKNVDDHSVMVGNPAKKLIK